MTTIYDIARAAGVNPSSVSYALSGKGTLSSTTRARILQCARDLGYRPNHVARSLIKRKTNTIGLIVPDISHPFFAELAQITDRLAHARGLRVFVLNTLYDKNLGQELLDDLVARRADGVIVVPGGVSLEAMRGAEEAGLPVLGSFWEESKSDVQTAVSVDFGAGGRIAAEHLWELGHRRVGLVTQLEVEQIPDHHLRAAGFQHALEERGQSLPQELIRMGKSSVEGGKEAALSLLHLAERPTAIFATNDLMAIGAIAAAWTSGLHVPTDVSIVGFDDIVTAAYTVPPLTSVRIDKEAVMTLTLDLLLTPPSGHRRAVVSSLCPILVVRHSTRSMTA